jgi:hypothetical protein
MGFEESIGTDVVCRDKRKDVVTPRALFSGCPDQAIKQNFGRVELREVISLGTGALANQGAPPPLVRFTKLSTHSPTFTVHFAITLHLQ